MSAPPREEEHKSTAFYDMKNVGQVKILVPPAPEYSAATNQTESFLPSANTPDSFALICDNYIAVQFKAQKLIQIYKKQHSSNSFELHHEIKNAISRNGKSFCYSGCYLGIRNMVKKCFEIIDIESTKSMTTFAYDDIWYYNNYHVLGKVFVFPHYMKATFFDSTNNF